MPWVTVTVCPAIVSVPVRDAVVGATVMLTLPMPVPDVGPVNVTHVTLLEAVHEQLDPVVTEMPNTLPESGAEIDAGATVAGQPVADWVTVTVAPAVTIVPTRVAPVVFAATVKLTWPRPWPVTPVIVIQASGVVAV